jgi:hypothetical protein
LHRLGVADLCDGGGLVAGVGQVESDRELDAVCSFRHSRISDSSGRYPSIDGTLASRSAAVDTRTTVAAEVGIVLLKTGRGG